MTTIITRLFPDPNSASNAVDRLIRKGVPKRACKVITASDTAQAALTRAKVHESAVDIYTRHIRSGAAAVVVQATYKPLGVVRLTREVLAAYDTVHVDNAVEEHKPAWTPDHAPSVMKDHPLFLSIPGLAVPGRMSSQIGMPLLKKHKKKSNLMAANRRMSRMFWPMKLVSKNRNARSAMHGTRHMSKAFWPGPLLSSGKRRKSVIPHGGQPLSTLLGFRTITSRH